MTKRDYNGLYMRAPTKPAFKAYVDLTPPSKPEAPNDWDFYTKMITSYVSTFYATISGNFVVIVTLLFVMVLTFLLPDISNKLQASQELKSMKELMGKMTSEVKQAEVSCLAVADEICCLHCAVHKSNLETQKEMRDLSICTSHCMQTTQSEPARNEKEVGFIRRIFFSNRNPSNKEVTIMSYVYTDSFDAQKPMITSRHMVINLWERWILQNQLTSMKQDLYSLTESITSLKSHYDFFEAELSDVLKLIQNKKAKAYGHHSDKQNQELHRYIV